MADRITEGEENRKSAEAKAERGRKEREMREILRQCEKAYRTIAGHGPDELDMLISETVGVDDDGSCRITFTVDMQKLKHPDKEEALEKKGLFYQSIDVLKDAFKDLASRRKLTPFTLQILGRDGAVIKRVDVK